VLCSHFSTSRYPPPAAAAQRCAYAAEGGHLEVMQWARDHGAPWDEDYVRELAAEG